MVAVKLEEARKADQTGKEIIICTLWCTSLDSSALRPILMLLLCYINKPMEGRAVCKVFFVLHIIQFTDSM